MKKLLVPIMVLALVALAVPVWAHVQCQDHDCNISLDGSVDFSKCVTIDQVRVDYYFTGILACFNPAARADAEAIICKSNHDNELTIGAATIADNMCGSFDFFTGIGQSNQAAGSMNNQANAVAVAYVSNAQTYASSLAAVADNNKDNNIRVTYGREDNDHQDNNRCDPKPIAVLTQTDSMSFSFNCFTGIGQSNQSAGSLNKQDNVVAIAAGVGEHSGQQHRDGKNEGGIGNAVAVAASELALNNTCNSFTVDKATLTNSMTGSFNGFTGIGQSNQSAGNMNNQANVISVAASVSK
jgi:hypothetical protein